MCSYLLVFLTCGMTFFSNQSDNQLSSQLQTPIDHIAMAQIDSADYWTCSGCGLKFPNATRTCLNTRCNNFRKSK